jgi:hypothetical protein
MKLPFLVSIIVTAYIFTAYSGAAGDPAVVVDVSGSMKNYGSWQADARDAISAILAGRPLPNRWQSTPPGADLGAYGSGTQGLVTLLPFGSVRATAEYPYFDRMRSSLTAADLDAQFPMKRSDFTEGHTNNALAEAVAIHALGAGSVSVRVIMLSDFLADATLAEQQLAFVNETQGKYAKYTDATLSWKENPRVQIKLLRFAPVNARPPKGDAPENGSLRLAPARYDERSQSVSLAWNYEGLTPPEKFDVKVSDARRGTVLFSKHDLSGNSVTYPKAAAGPMRWSVTAFMQDGKTVEQSATYSVPGTGGSPVALLVLLAAVAALVGAGVVALKKYGLPDFLAGLKRRNDTDI